MLFNVSKALCINVSTTIFVFFQGSFQTTTNRWWDLADSSAFIWSVQIAVSSNGFVLYWVFPMTFALCLSAVTIMTEQYGLATRATSPERTWKPRDALTNRLEVSGWRMVVPLYNKVASLLQILPFHFAACLFSPPPLHLSLLLFFTYLGATLHPPPEPVLMKEWSISSQRASLRICALVMWLLEPRLPCCIISFVRQHFSRNGKREKAALGWKNKDSFLDSVKMGISVSELWALQRLRLVWVVDCCFTPWQNVLFF